MSKYVKIDNITKNLAFEAMRYKDFADKELKEEGETQNYARLTGLADANKNAFDYVSKEIELHSLTWRDIQRIINIADRLCNDLEYDKIKAMGEEGYYTEILNSFNEEKQR